ncbi:MAG: hypothetical protein R2800_08635 [Flavipsychrobacter sp.]
MRLLSILCFCLIIYGCKKTQPSINNYPEQEAFRGVINKDSFNLEKLDATILPKAEQPGKYYININCYTPYPHQYFYIHIEEATLQTGTYTIKHTTTTDVKYNYAYYGAWSIGNQYADFVAGGYVNIHSISNNKLKGNLYFTTEQGRQIQGVFNLNVKM